MNLLEVYLSKGDRLVRLWAFQYGMYVISALIIFTFLDQKQLELIFEGGGGTEEERINNIHRILKNFFLGGDANSSINTSMWFHILVLSILAITLQVINIVEVVKCWKTIKATNYTIKNTDNNIVKESVTKKKNYLLFSFITSLLIVFMPFLHFIHAISVISRALFWRSLTRLKIYALASKFSSFI